MNILVNLSNLMLSEAVTRLISSFGGDFAPEIAERLPLEATFEPQIMLVDLARLGAPMRPRWRQAKTVLVDTGLKEQEIAGLLVYHSLDGIIATDTDSDLLQKALRVIHSGELWIDHRQIKCLMRNSATLNRREAFENLTDKDRQIIALVSKGLRNREIADQLFLSEQTIKAHVSHIYKKLQVNNRSQLVSLVTRHPIADA